MWICDIIIFYSHTQHIFFFFYTFIMCHLQLTRRRTKYCKTKEMCRSASISPHIFKISQYTYIIAIPTIEVTGRYRYINIGFSRCCIGIFKTCRKKTRRRWKKREKYAWGSWVKKVVLWGHCDESRLFGKEQATVGWKKNKKKQNKTKLARWHSTAAAAAASWFKTRQRRCASAYSVNIYNTRSNVTQRAIVRVCISLHVYYNNI